MSGAAQLGNLLNVTADLNYYTMMLTEWSNKYEANSEKLKQQVSYETKYDDAYEDATGCDKKIDYTDRTGKKWQKEKETAMDDTWADGYAHAKVYQYDESLSLELAELDIEYDTMKTMYEALVTQLQAEKDADKQSTATAMQDTHLLQS